MDFHLRSFVYTRFDAWKGRLRNMSSQIHQTLSSDTADVLEMGQLITVMGILGLAEIIQRPLCLDLDWISRLGWEISKYLSQYSRTYIQSTIIKRSHNDLGWDRRSNVVWQQQVSILVLLNGMGHDSESREVMAVLVECVILISDDYIRKTTDATIKFEQQLSIAFRLGLRWQGPKKHSPLRKKFWWVVF